MSSTITIHNEILDDQKVDAVANPTARCADGNGTLTSAVDVRWPPRVWRARSNARNPGESGVAS